VLRCLLTASVVVIAAGPFVQSQSPAGDQRLVTGAGARFSGGLVTEGTKGVAVFKVLGFFDEYLGRQTFDGDDRIERFYPGEHAKADRLAALLAVMARQQGIVPNMIRKEVDPDRFVTFRSPVLAPALNRLYLERAEVGFFERPEGRIPLIRLNVSAAMFAGATREMKIAYISGAYCRHGRSNAIGFANGGHKAVVLTQLLREIGCKDVKHSSITDRVPNTNVVTFSQCGPPGWLKGC
jgi:hypothetical protein